MRDMTRGGIGSQILIFSIPLMFSNVFQLLYGIANSVIAGRCLGKSALAAAGTAIPVMNIMFFLIGGVTLGASVLTAEFFGSGDEEKFRDEAVTAMTSGLIFTLLLILLGFVFLRPALMLINVPNEIMPQTAAYLRIFFAGLVFAFLYNHYSAVLRSVGESAAPLYILVLSSLLNVVLALLFILRLGFGLEGAAWATFISQAFSAFLSLYYIFWRVPLLRPGKKFLRIERSLLKKTISYASVSGIQQAVLYIGIFLMQGAVNPLGIDAIAAFNAVSRTDSLVMTLSDSLATSLMMFVSQNKGARCEERVRAGLRVTLVFSFAATAFCSLFLILAPERIALIFLDPGERGALSLSVLFFRIMSAVYMFAPICNTFQGFFRGVGRLDVVLYATFVQIPVRVGTAYLLISSLGMNSVAAGIAFGWICMAVYQIFEFVRYLKGSLCVKGEKRYGFGL